MKTIEKWAISSKEAKPHYTMLPLVIRGLCKEQRDRDQTIEIITELLNVKLMWPGAG